MLVHLVVCDEEQEDRRAETKTVRARFHDFKADCGTRAPALVVLAVSPLFLPLLAASCAALRGEGVGSFAMLNSFPGESVLLLSYHKFEFCLYFCTI